MFWVYGQYNIFFTLLMRASTFDLCYGFTANINIFYSFSAGLTLDIDLRAVKRVKNCQDRASSFHYSPVETPP